MSSTPETARKSLKSPKNKTPKNDKSPKSKSKSPFMASSGPNAVILLNDYIELSNGTFAQVKFIGKCPTLGKGVYYGIEYIDGTITKYNGIINNKLYFNGKENRCKFVKRVKIRKKLKTMPKHLLNKQKSIKNKNKQRKRTKSKNNNNMSLLLSPKVTGSSKIKAFSSNNTPNSLTPNFTYTSLKSPKMADLTPLDINRKSRRAKSSANIPLDKILDNQKSRPDKSIKSKNSFKSKIFRKLKPKKRNSRNNNTPDSTRIRSVSVGRNHYRNNSVVSLDEIDDDSELDIDGNHDRQLSLSSLARIARQEAANKRNKLLEEKQKNAKNFKNKLSDIRKKSKKNILDDYLNKKDKIHSQKKLHKQKQILNQEKLLKQQQKASKRKLKLSNAGSDSEAISTIKRFKEQLLKKKKHKKKNDSSSNSHNRSHSDAHMVFRELRKKRKNKKNKKNKKHSIKNKLNLKINVETSDSENDNDYNFDATYSLSHSEDDSSEVTISDIIKMDPESEFFMFPDIDATLLRKKSAPILLDTDSKSNSNIKHMNIAENKHRDTDHLSDSSNGTDGTIQILSDEEYNSENDDKFEYKDLDSLFVKVNSNHDSNISILSPNNNLSNNDGNLSVISHLSVLSPQSNISTLSSLANTPLTLSNNSSLNNGENNGRLSESLNIVINNLDSLQIVNDESNEEKKEPEIVTTIGDTVYTRSTLKVSDIDLKTYKRDLGYPSPISPIMRRKDEVLPYQPLLRTHNSSSSNHENKSPVKAIMKELKQEEKEEKKEEKKTDDNENLKITVDDKKVFNDEVPYGGFSRSPVRKKRAYTTTSLPKKNNDSGGLFTAWGDDIDYLELYKKQEEKRRKKRAKKTKKKLLSKKGTKLKHTTSTSNIFKKKSKKKKNKNKNNSNENNTYSHQTCLRHFDSVNDLLLTRNESIELRANRLGFGKSNTSQNSDAPNHSRNSSISSTSSTISTISTLSLQSTNSNVNQNQIDKFLNSPLSDKIKDKLFHQSFPNLLNVSALNEKDKKRLNSTVSNGDKPKSRVFRGELQINNQYLLNDTRIAVCKYIGKVEFADGLWIGMEVISGPRGTNDGMVKGKRYFSVRRREHGIFIRRNKIVSDFGPFKNFKM